MKLYLIGLLVALHLAASPAAQAQGVTFGAAGAPAASALLELRSTTQGWLPPRPTATQRQAIASPAVGLLVYQTDGQPGLYTYAATGWLSLAAGQVLEATRMALPANTGAAGVAAGSGTAGLQDDVGVAAQFNQPSGLALDRWGNLYVADTGNHCIREVLAATGDVLTLAGTGQAGAADGPAATATFNSPSGVAVDQDGNVYVADQGNHRIRKLTVASGLVSTLAGTGTAGLVDGPGTQAAFRSPSDVAVALNGNVYVADQGNHGIRCIVAGTGTVTTLAGGRLVLLGTTVPVAGSLDGTGGAARFNQPTGLAVSPAGVLYVADLGNNRVRQVDVTTGAVSTVAPVNSPGRLALAPDGALYVTSRATHQVQKIVNAAVSLFSGTTPGYTNGMPTVAQFNEPAGVVATVTGMLYVADAANNRIREVQ